MVSPYSLIIKPVGPVCDQRCTYCFYTDKIEWMKRGQRMRISPALIERYIREHIEITPTETVQFIWQGGEPSLAGLEFFEHAFALQQRYCPPGKSILNAFQTHGGLLDRDWVKLFRDHDVLVGLSIDGPQAIHDRYRRDIRGRPTFRRVRRSLDMLLGAGVEVNAMCVVHALNWRRGAQIYRFFRRIGLRHMQFIPIVETRGEETGEMSPESVPAGGYATFLNDVFDVWSDGDMDRVFVQSFETAIATLYGMESLLCVFAKSCGRAPIMEVDGSVYACDHFVEPEYLIGKLGDESLAALVGSPELFSFGAAKANLAGDCLTCRWKPFCNGGCPKHRLIDDGMAGAKRNHLCESYKGFFSHAVPRLQKLLSERPAARH